LGSKTKASAAFELSSLRLQLMSTIEQTKKDKKNTIDILLAIVVLLCSYPALI